MKTREGAGFVFFSDPAGSGWPSFYEASQHLEAQTERHREGRGGGRGQRLVARSQFEFEFALDLMLDGLERLRDSG